MICIDLKSGNTVTPNFPTVLCIGNFDGVHIGHRMLIERTVSRSKELKKQYPNLRSGAWCFDSLTSAFFADDVLAITSNAQKLQLFSELGLDCVFIANFESMRNMPASEFTDEILKKQCNCIHAVCGFNFRYGRFGAGASEDLRLAFDGNCDIIEQVKINDASVSSSNIRSLIRDGNVEFAAKMLGRHFDISSEVCHGKTLGRNLGFPTANQIIPENSIVPKNGTYATYIKNDGQVLRAVTNIGIRPTFDDGNKLSCETFIIGYNGDLYGKSITVYFLKRLRNEKAFSSEHELKEQINRDITASVETPIEL